MRRLVQSLSTLIAAASLMILAGVIASGATAFASGDQDLAKNCGTVKRVEEGGLYFLRCTNPDPVICLFPRTCKSTTATPAVGDQCKCL